jgi:hypothetical protein
VHAVEGHAEEMRDLLGVTPSVPAGLLVGAGGGRQARDGYDVAVVIYGYGLSQLADRGALSCRIMWLALGARASSLLAHA